MQVLLIGNKETADNPERYYGDYVHFFRQAAGLSASKPTIEFTLFDNLVITVGEGVFSIFDTRHDVDISSYQLILIRGKGFRNLFDVVKTISSYARYKKVRVINDYSGFRDSSKLMQATQFFELGIPVAQTVYVTPAVLAGKAPLGFSFPCIMKATFGAHGNDNYLVHDMQKAAEIAASNPHIRFVLQRLVPNNNDYRILIIGEEVLVISREAVAGSHLNNTSQGGTAELVDLSLIPASVIEDARRMVRHLDMTFAGVDVLSDKQTGEFFFLEVNSQPQLMSGAFIDSKAEIIGRYFDSLTA